MKSWYKIAQEDYRDAHTSPDANSGAPLYDLTNVYPDDIYSWEAERLYGTGASYDNESLNIIRYAKGKPNARVIVYRAVPDPNAEIKKEIQKLNNILNYQFKYGFFPIGNEIVNEIENNHSNDNYSYDELRKVIREDIELKINELRNSMSSRIKINAGDWVTLSKRYAQDHAMQSGYGASRILQKTVLAKDLYTNGDSIHEWGWSP